MLIREIKIDDAKDFTNLIKEVEAKANYMLMGAGERKTTPEQQRKQLERIVMQYNSTIFVAEEERLLGYMMALGGSVNRTKHSAYIVIGILADFRGKGIGTALFRNLERWAINHNVSRLELTVVTQMKQV